MTLSRSHFIGSERYRERIREPSKGRAKERRGERNGERGKSKRRGRLHHRRIPKTGGPDKGLDDGRRKRRVPWPAKMRPRAREKGEGEGVDCRRGYGCLPLLLDRFRLLSCRRRGLGSCPDVLGAVARRRFLYVSRFIASRLQKRECSTARPIRFACLFDI